MNIVVPIELSIEDIQNLVTYLNCSSDSWINDIVERILIKTETVCEEFKETIDVIQQQNPYKIERGVSKWQTLKNINIEEF